MPPSEKPKDQIIDIHRHFGNGKLRIVGEVRNWFHDWKGRNLSLPPCLADINWLRMPDGIKVPRYKFTGALEKQEDGSYVFYSGRIKPGDLRYLSHITVLDIRERLTWEAEHPDRISAFLKAHGLDNLTQPADHLQGPLYENSGKWLSWENVTDPVHFGGYIRKIHEIRI